MNDKNDEEIRRLLEKCCDTAMESLDEESASEENYDLTRRFVKRMKRMLWSEKHFGHRLKLGYAVRRVAVFLIILAGVLGSATVSAKVFDFRPWEYIPGYDWFVTDEVDDLPADYHDEDPVVATPKPKPTAKPEKRRAYPTTTPKDNAVSGEAAEVTDGNKTPSEEDALQEESYTDDPRKSTDEPSATEPGAEDEEDPRKEEEPREYDSEPSEENEDEDEN